MDSDSALFRRVWQRVTDGSSPIVCGDDNAPNPTTLTPALPEVTQPMLPLTAASPEVNDFLRERIECELKAARSCRTLPARSGGALRDVSDRCCQRARRLAAALLLLSGVWYLPEDTGPLRTWPDYRSGLRGLFHLFQRDAQLYCAAAEGCRDELLRELFLELSGENVVLRDRVRGLVEKS